MQDVVDADVPIEVESSNELPRNFECSFVWLDLAIHNRAELQQVADITADSFNLAIVCKQTNGVVQTFLVLLEDDFVTALVDDTAQLVKRDKVLLPEAVEQRHVVTLFIVHYGKALPATKVCQLAADVVVVLLGKLPYVLRIKRDNLVGHMQFPKPFVQANLVVCQRQGLKREDGHLCSDGFKVGAVLGHNIEVDGRNREDGVNRILLAELEHRWDE